MQDAVANAKRDAERADLAYAEIAIESDGKLTPQKISNLFRGYRAAGDEEIAALDAAIDAAIRRKTRRLFQVRPAVVEAALA